MSAETTYRIVEPDENTLAAVCDDLDRLQAAYRGYDRAVKQAAEEAPPDADWAELPAPLLGAIDALLVAAGPFARRALVAVTPEGSRPVEASEAASIPLGVLHEALTRYHDFAEGRAPSAAAAN